MGGLAFEDLLDEILVTSPILQRSAGGRPVAGTATAYGFFFIDAPAAHASIDSTATRAFIARPDWRLDSVNGAAQPCTRLRSAVEASGPAPEATHRPVEPGRVMSARERQAVDELASLGGPLSADFTFDELRRVFRMLALRYHPDRHAGGGKTDTSQLARLFTRARDAYQILTEVFARVH